MQTVQLSHKGVAVNVPAVTIDGWAVMVTGKRLKLATIYDEDWLDGEPVRHPEVFVRELTQGPLRADLFSFARKLPETKQRYAYPFEWDNVAAIPITSYADWWEKRVSHDLRKDVKRAEKRGVVVRCSAFDDVFVRGIKEIYDEAPVRQGRPFWHYGKPLDQVQQENATYLDRSEFIGAYLGDELIGFIKLIYVDGMGRLLQILSKAQHYDKRPMNALIAKAVEVSAQKGCSYLTYGNYTYGNKRKDSLIDFKRRNGFEKIVFPRYFVPLTLKGRLALKARLHRGWQGLLPPPVIYFLLAARSWIRGYHLNRANPETSAAVVPDPPSVPSDQ